MKGNISKKYFIGKSSKRGEWASVYTYKPRSEEVYHNRGQIFATIVLIGPPEFSISTAGNFLLDHLHESYFENTTDSALMALEKAAIATSKRLQKLMQHDEAAKEGIEMHLTSLVQIDKYAYLVNMGNGSIHLLRDGNLSSLASNLKDPTGAGIIRTGSMITKEADVYIIGTPTVIEELSLDELIGYAVDFSVRKLKQMEFKNESKFALMLAGVDVDRKESKEEFGLHKTFVEEIDKGLDTLENTRAVEDIEDLKLGKNEEKEGIVENREAGKEKGNERAEFEDKIEGELGEIPSRANIMDKIRGVFAKLKLIRGDKSKKKQLEVRQPVVDITEKEDVSDIPARQVQNVRNKTDSQDDPTYKVLLRKLKEGVMKMLGGLKKLVWEDWLEMGKEEVYVKGVAGRKKKKMRFLIVLVAVVAGIIYFSTNSVMNKVEENDALKEAEAIYNSAVSLIDEVEPLVEVKAVALNIDPAKQSLFDKLEEAQSKLDQVSSMEEYANKAIDQTERINEYINTLNRVIVVESDQELIDFGNKFPGSKAVDMVVFDGKIYVIDQEYSKLYKLDYTGGNPVELTSDLTSPRSITVDNDGDIVVLDDDADNKLATIDHVSGEINRHAGTSQFRVGNISTIEFADIAGGRVYGIDQSLKQIVYLPKSTSSYGIPQSRYEASELATAEDLHIIDLKIYILMDVKQGLFRYYNDQDDTPALIGMQAGEDLLDSTAMFVDGEYVYIADPTKQRVLVFSKDVTELKMLGQYVYEGGESDGFKNITEIVGDRVNGKIFVLDSSKVYKLDLTKINKY